MGEGRGGAGAWGGGSGLRDVLPSPDSLARGPWIHRGALASVGEMCRAAIVDSGVDQPRMQIRVFPPPSQAVRGTFGGQFLAGESPLHPGCGCGGGGLWLRSPAPSDPVFSLIY